MSSSPSPVIPWKVKEIMTPRVVTISDDRTVLDAAKLMDEKGIGCLVVVKDGKTEGIITERDVVNRVVGEGIDPSKVRVGDLMSKPVVTCNLNADLIDVIELMRERDIRRLVIVDEQGRLAGIVTERDVLAYAHPLLRYAYHLVKKGAGRRAF